MSFRLIFISFGGNVTSKTCFTCTWLRCIKGKPADIKSHQMRLVYWQNHHIPSCHCTSQMHNPQLTHLLKQDLKHHSHSLAAPAVMQEQVWPKLLPLLLPLRLHMSFEGFRLSMWKQGFPLVTAGRAAVAPDTSKGHQTLAHQHSDMLCPGSATPPSSPPIPSASPAAWELQIKIRALTDSNSSYVASLSLRDKLCSDQPQAPTESSHSISQWGRVVIGHASISGSSDKASKTG